MFPSRWFIHRFAARAGLVIGGMLLAVSVGADTPRSLPLRWQTAITARELGAAPPAVVAGRVIAASGEMLAVGQRVVPLTLSGPGGAMPLATSALIIDGAVDAQGDLWVGGRIRQRAWFPGGDLADAYLGHFTRTGEKRAEFSFGGGQWHQITAVHPLRDGDVLVGGEVGRAGGGAWLARVSPAGRLRWEKTQGLPDASAIAEGSDGAIAWLQRRSIPNASRIASAPVTFNLLDAQGKGIAEYALVDEDGSALALLATPDGYFVLVGSNNPSNSTPMRVFRRSLSGEASWQTTLPQTASAWPGRAGVWRKCEVRAAILDNGDLIATCSVDGELILSRLNGKTGALAQQAYALPACHEKRPAVVTPLAVGHSRLRLIGTRPENNVAAACAWLAEIDLDF